MKIVFFSRLFYPHIGGVEKHVLKLSENLQKKGHNITVITEQHSSRLKLEEEFEGIKIYRIPNLKEGKFKKFKIWKYLFKNRSIIKTADIVHCHDVFFWYLPLRFIFPFKKVFTTFHGYEGYPLKIKDILMRKFSEKLSFGNICIGDFIKKWYGTKPDYVSYGAVDEARNKKQKTKIENSAVFIGRLDEQTSIKTYVEAAKIIRKRIPDFKFEIIGDGKYKNEIGRSFKVLGFKKNAEKYLQNYNFAFVSRYLAILEAMVAKKLVFAVFDNPIKKDYLRMTPFVNLLNIASSPEELSDQVFLHFKSPKKRNIMIEKAREWAKKQSWEKATSIYLMLWDK